MHHGPRTNVSSSEVCTSIVYRWNSLKRRWPVVKLVRNIAEVESTMANSQGAVKIFLCASD